MLGLVVETDLLVGLGIRTARTVGKGSGLWWRWWGLHGSERPSGRDRRGGCRCSDRSVVGGLRCRRVGPVSGGRVRRRLFYAESLVD